MTVDQSPTLGVDALKRRYQVFVSSTYEDLKEERQHVIQALLETKCIPLGMELFPAATAMTHLIRTEAHPLFIVSICS